MIESIMNWPTPNNVKYERYFMVLVGYYRRFIEGVSKVSHPITCLKNKGIKFEWTKNCEESFQMLKKHLTSALILKIVNSKNEFVVCIYACKHGVR